MAIPPVILLIIILGVDLHAVGYLSPTTPGAELDSLASTYQYRIKSQVNKLHTNLLHQLTEGRYSGPWS